MQKEEIIKKYFGAWINKDIDVVKQTFSEDVIYSECYGPEYRGLWQVLQWFEDWNQSGQVLEWTIQKVISQGDTIVVDWFFKCDYKGEVGAFDGVTIADFDKDMKIVKLREFQSKAEHYYPYEVTVPLDFEFYFRQLKAGLNINETCFCFSDDKQEVEHYIGYLPQYEKPYWVGNCDIKDGCEFSNAEELVNAKIYNGKSLAERWQNVVIRSIEGVSVKDWLKHFVNSRPQS